MNTYRRHAVTLTEVLIAIFVMALGLMSILALFPVAAVQMAQALKDQRSAECSANAAAWFRMAWKDTCELGKQGKPTARQRFVIALDDPNNTTESAIFPPASPDSSMNLGAPPLGGFNSLQSLGSGVFDVGGEEENLLELATLLSTLTVNQFPIGGPSYPVFVDSIGWQGWQNASNGVQQWWVGGQDAANYFGNSYALPRRPLYVRQQVVAANNTVSDQFINLNTFGTQRVLRHFSLADDMTFDKEGKASQPIERQGKYTWSFMVRRPNNLVARQIDLTVVVYGGRSIDVPSKETAYSATNIPGAGGGTEIILNYDPTREKPAVRRGTWVLDSTMLPTPQGFFYRVVNVNDDTPNQLRLEVQTPVRTLTAAGDANFVPRRFVVMENVVEVFEKGTIDPKEEIRPY